MTKGQLKATRRSERRHLGTLSDNRIGKPTLSRYSEAMEFFLQWLLVMHDDLPDAPEDMDAILCEWGEHLWEEGE